MSKELEIRTVLSSLSWLKDKEASKEDLYQAGLLIDEIVEVLANAKQRKIDVLHLLRDVFIVSAMENEGQDKENFFKLFNVITEMLEENGQERKQD